MVHSGFGVLGLSLAVLFALYVLQHWQRVVSAPPLRPRRPELSLGCGIGILSLAAAMMYRGLAGPGRTGPTGFVAVEQRTVLVIITMLATPAALVYGMTILKRSREDADLNGTPSAP